MFSIENKNKKRKGLKWSWKEDQLFDHKTAFVIKLENNKLKSSVDENLNLKIEPKVPSGVET